MARSVIQEVEEEFGEPFWDVVRGFAADGHSVHATAILLGYADDSTSFRRLIKRNNMNIEFASAQESVFQVEAREYRKGKCSDAQRESLKRASENNPTYKVITYRGFTDTIIGHVRRLGLSKSTVYKRYLRKPDDLDYVFSTTPNYVAPPKGKGLQSKEMRALASPR